MCIILFNCLNLALAAIIFRQVTQKIPSEFIIRNHKKIHKKGNISAPNRPSEVTNKQMKILKLLNPNQPTQPKIKTFEHFLNTFIKKML